MLEFNKEGGGWVGQVSKHASSGTSQVLTINSLSVSALQRPQLMKLLSGRVIWCTVVGAGHAQG